MAALYLVTKRQREAERYLKAYVVADAVDGDDASCSPTTTRDEAR